MMKKFDPFIPDPDCGFGRDNLRDRIIRGALDKRSVLYFGGRQSGKTTLLLRIVKELGRPISSKNLDTFVCPVYVDLSLLSFDSGPGEFYAHLCGAAVKSCRTWIEGFEIDEQRKFSGAQSISEFASNIQEITSSAGQIDLTILFLLDEAERIVSERFPRGFHDNLFSLLYGPDLASKTKVGMVFSGAQSLYKFAEDKTSPIGSRALFLYNRNLNREDLDSYFDWLAERFEIIASNLVRDEIFTLCGGHPGLTARASAFIASCNIRSIEQLKSVSEEFEGECQQLLRVWTSSLSAKARAVHDGLAVKGVMSIREVAAIHSANGWDPILSDRALDELVFSGIAKYEVNSLACINHVYWAYIKKFVNDESSQDLVAAPPRSLSDAQAEVWALIRKVEITLRSYVGGLYSEKYTGSVESAVAAVLGAKAMDKVRANVEKSNSRYKYTQRQEVITLFDGLYLGQLGQLMTSKASWKYFCHLFQDKRELELMLAPITAVRTDEAHFYSTPDRELMRCKINCEDLLGIIERSLPSQAV